MNTPTPNQVKEIYKYVYLLFVKFKDANSDKEFQDLIKESHELHQKYPFDLCKNQLVDIACIIDGYYKERELNGM